GLECAAFHDPDRREGRDEGHAQWHTKRAKKNTSKAWNAQHSMIPTAGRDVTKVTPSGTQNVPKRTVPSGTFVPKRTVPSGTHGVSRRP
ncbi:MAG: hypothetical protein J6U66_12080, partial [Lachnospiraceae bacterium]|nr:hypothetical protein [Lachnospiraceae bacterium]